MPYNKDIDHLKILSIFHYVHAGLCALISPFGLIYLVMGIIMAISPEIFDEGKGPPPPAFVGWILAIIGLVVSLGMLGVGFLSAAAGLYLSKQKHYTFCLVVSAIEMLNQPLGTILGVFTIIVLMRPSVKELFGSQKTYDYVPPGAL